MVNLSEIPITINWKEIQWEASGSGSGPGSYSGEIIADGELTLRAYAVSTSTTTTQFTSELKPLIDLKDYQKMTFLSVETLSCNYWATGGSWYLRVTDGTKSKTVMSSSLFWGGPRPSDGQAPTPIVNTNFIVNRLSPTKFYIHTGGENVGGIVELNDFDNTKPWYIIFGVSAFSSWQGANKGVDIYFRDYLFIAVEGIGTIVGTPSYPIEAYVGYPISVTGMVKNDGIDDTIYVKLIDVDTNIEVSGSRVAYILASGVSTQFTINVIMPNKTWNLALEAGHIE